MKSVKSVIITLMVLCCSCMIFGISLMNNSKPVSAAATQITNGDFSSTDLSAWMTDCWIQANTTQVVESGELKLTNLVDTHQFVGQKVSLVAGQKYTLTFTMRTENITGATVGGEGAFLEVTGATSGQLTIAGYVGATEGNCGTKSAQTFKVSLNPTVSEDYGIRFWLASVSGTIWIDNVELKAETDLISDGGFDNGDFSSWSSSWAQNADATKVVESGRAKLTNATETNQYIGQLVTLVAGEGYIIKFELETVGLAGAANDAEGAYLIVREESTLKEVAKVGCYGADAGTGSSAKQTYTASFVAETSGTYNVRFWMCGVSGTAYLDNVSLTSNTYGLFEDGGFDSGSLDGWSLVWKQDDNATSSFEAGTFKMTNSAESNQLIRKSITLMKDMTYRFSFDVKTENVTGATGGGQGVFAIVSGATSGQLFTLGMHGATNGNCGTTDWQTFTNTFIAPKTESFDFEFWLGSVSGTMWLDNIRLVEIVDVEADKHWATEASYPTDFSDGSFTFVGIGDPQNFAKRADPSGSYYMDLFKWIADNKTNLNIKYALNIGDIVDQCPDEGEWQIAQNAHKQLEAVDLRYALTMGNHDYNGYWNLFDGLPMDRTATYFEKYFPYENYKSWESDGTFGIVDFDAGTMQNTWHKFTDDVGNKYLIVTLEYGVRASTVAKAKAIIDANPDHHVIISTHAYLNGDLTYNWNGWSDLGHDGAITPVELHDTLITKCPNIFMVLCGHTVSYGVSTSVIYGDAGNPIIQMKVDPQATFNDRESLIALYKIKGTSVETYYYSVSSGRYYAGSNFSIDPVQGTSSENGGVVKVAEGFKGDLLGFESKDEVTPKSTYSSTNTNVATIDENGIVTAVGVGTTTITYDLDGKRSAYADVGVVTRYTVTLVVEHVFDKQVATDKYLASSATCTDKAKYYYSCSCGEKGTQTFTYGEALGHTEVIDQAILATCTSTGLTEGKHCSVCNEVILAQEVTDKLSHEYVNEVVAPQYLLSPATATEPAVYYHSCKCGEKGTTTFTYGNPLVEEPEATVDLSLLKLDFASVSLFNNFQVNFKVAKDKVSGFENLNLCAEMASRCENITEYVESGNNVVFVFKNVLPSQMGTEIKLTLSGEVDGVRYYGTESFFTVSNYCYIMLNNSEYNQDSELCTLLVDLLNYGTEAQKKAGITEGYVNGNLTKEQKELASSEPVLETVENVNYEDENYSSVENASVTWKSAGLNILTDGIAVRIKIAVDSVDGLSIVFKNQTGNIIYTATEFYETEDGYYVYLSLSASQVRTVFYATAYNGENAVSNTLRYSVESYAYKMQSTEYGDLVKALIKYGDSAYMYNN